jgi:flagellar hook assembly protein FlgD
MQVVPNPIRESGWIRYQLAAPAHELTIEILDVTGRQLQSWGLESGRAGVFELRWDGTDRDGRPLPMGTYFYRARSTNRLTSGKFQVLR